MKASTKIIQIVDDYISNSPYKEELNLVKSDLINIATEAYLEGMKDTMKVSKEAVEESNQEFHEKLCQLFHEWKK